MANLQCYNCEKCKSIETCGKCREVKKYDLVCLVLDLGLDFDNTDDQQIITELKEMLDTLKNENMKLKKRKVYIDEYNIGNRGKKDAETTDVVLQQVLQTYKEVGTLDKLRKVYGWSMGTAHSRLQLAMLRFGGGTDDSH